MGKNLVFVPECPSTNTLALEISQQSPVKEGTLVITDHQTAGKGQRGNVWEAEAGKNLTFSLILKPAFLAVNSQFSLNMVICLALKDYLTTKTSDSIHIKWPNDILVHQKKISGVLIENQVHGNVIGNSIAGIGLNVNQAHFGNVSATSLAIVTQREHVLEEELPILLGYIESRYLQLRAGRADEMKNQYLQGLYRRDENHTFLRNGESFEGTITGIDDSGRLCIREGGELKSYGVKEIQYV